MKPFRSCCAFVATVCLSISHVFGASAPPLADRVPENVVLYVGWNGADATTSAPEYQQSHLKALLDNSNIKQVANELLPKLLAKAAQQGGPEAAQYVDTFKLIGGTLWRYPTALYFNVEMGGGNPMPQAAIFCRAGGDAVVIQKRLDDLLAEANTPPQVPIRTFVVEDIVGVSVGYEDGTMALAGGDKTKPISVNENFEAALAKLGASDTAFVAYYDIDRLIEIADAGVQMSNQPELVERWPRIREASGISGIHRLIVASGFDGKGWTDRVYVHAPAPRKGIVSLFDSSPLPDDVVKMIPANATNVMAGGFDMAKAINEIRTVLGDVHPEAQEQFGQVLGLAQMYTGVNLETDLFGALGEHWAIYEDPSVAGPGFLGMVAVNKLRDPAKAERAIMAVMNAAANTASAQTRKDGLQFLIRNITSDNITVNYLAIPFISPAWTVKDGYLYVSLYPQNTLTVAKRGTPGKSIVDNAGYAALRSKLKVDRPTSITFSDLPKSAEQHYQMMLAVTRGGLGFADLFGISAPELVLPPLDQLQKHLEPAGGMSWADDSGFYYRSTTPFPGAGLVNGPSIAALAAPAAIGGAIGGMAERNRVRGPQMMCAAHLREIGQAIGVYANANGHLPPSLGALADNFDSPHAFICPNAGKEIPENWKDMTGEQRAEWVNKNTSYVYLGAGMTVEAAHSEIVILHDREQRHQGQGMNLLFGDGSVKFLPVQQAKQMIRTQRQGK